MKESYHGTLFYTDNLPEAEVILYFFDKPKYKPEGEKPRKVTVRGVKSWDIISGGEEAEQIEALTGEIDEVHEYLVLHFVGGCVNIYRNSHVAMFVL